MNKRNTLLAAASLAALLIENPATAESAKPGDVVQLNPNGDPRIKKAEWCDGCVITLIAAQGENFPLELPQGWRVQSVWASEQDVMDGITPVDEEEGERVFTRGAMQQQQQNEERRAEEGDNGCGKNRALSWCVRRGRFVMLMPSTVLRKQPVSMIVLESKGDKEIERNVVFELSTGQNKSDNYYSLRVLPPSAPVQPVTAAVPRASSAPRSAPRRNLGCPASGCLHLTQPQALAPVAGQRAARNNNYVVQGDKTLIGKGN